MKSVPTIPAASVGSEHTKNVCLNSRQYNQNETVCCLLMLRTSPVTPYGLASVTLKSLLEIPGCNIETFEPVSKIRLLDMPSIQTEIKGIPHSNAILTGGLSTAFSGTVRRKELSSFTPCCRFLKLWPPFVFPPSSVQGLFSRETWGTWGFALVPFSWRVRVFGFPFELCRTL